MGWHLRCMRRYLAPSLVLVLLIGSACGQGVSGTQSYTVGVDAASPEGENLQYSTFFPSTVKASPGDSVVFRNRSTQAPHTITFGVNADRSNQPPVVLPDGTESAVVTEPCFTPGAPTNKLTKCPDKELPAYAGTGYWNSGFLVPAPAPEGPKEVTVELADTIEPGQYRYLCVLHGPMAGVIEVVDEGDREPTDAVVELGDEELDEVRSEAEGIDEPQVGANVVAAGWSGGVTAVNRFLPETIEVKSGTKVTWEAFSDYEPHTVSFGPKYKSGVPGPGQTAPSGVKSGGQYSSGDANSGIFGKAGGPFPPGPYSLTFTRPGTYTYACVLHPGMQGTVRVT
jgi:plastocyanin